MRPRRRRMSLPVLAEGGSVRLAVRCITGVEDPVPLPAFTFIFHLVSAGTDR